MNNVSMVGRTTKEIDYKVTGTGTGVANFTLAVNRNFKNANGEREADFINCVAWRKTAELLANHVGKGDQIGVNGRIQTRNYENNQGQRVYVTEVVVEEVTFLGGGNKQKQSTDPFLQAGDPVEIDDSTLPF